MNGHRHSPLSDAGGQTLTGIHEFKVFRAKDSQDSFVLIATVSSTETTYTDESNLETDATYFYRVSATDAATNESGRSTSVAVAPVRRTQNSSPPTRATTSESRNVALSRSAKVRSTRSPPA